LEGYQLQSIGQDIRRSTLRANEIADGLESVLNIGRVPITLSGICVDGFLRDLEELTR
jgi:hypothetical protein